MSTTARITTRPGQGHVQVEVTYDGTRPPRALFADLTMIGWEAPALAPPPREAIDWTVPNPETGERFTVRSYLVEGAIVEAPRGSGPRGTWTDGERGVFLTTVQRVLAKHGLFEEVGATDVGRLPAPPGRPARPAPAATNPAPPAPAPAAVRPAPAATTPVLPPAATPVATTAPARWVRLDLAPALKDRVEMLLLGSGVDHRVELEDRTRTESFRGSKRKIPMTVLAVEFTAPDEVAGRLVVALEQLSTQATTASAPAAAPATIVGRLESGQARITAVFGTQQRQAVADVVAELRLTVVSETGSSITGTESFRGSSHEVQKPAIRLQVDVPVAQVGPVSATLATAGRIPADAADRLTVELPEPSLDLTPEPVLAAVPEPDAQPDPVTEAGPTADQSASRRSRKKLSTWSSASRVG